MTERLYHADSYLTEFEATLLEGDPNGQRLYLDQTAFYPTSGGQPFDRGVLRAGGSAAPLAVVDVVDEGERIAHVLAEPQPALVAGTRLTGTVDWARRFDHMQQHSGQHLLSAVFQEQLGCATLSVHFGAESSTLDLDAAALGQEQLQAVERRANALVWENRELTLSSEDAQEVSGLRKPSARSGALRIVSIAGLDRSACGGTHVRRTGEIGAIALRRLERVRKSVRVEFLCGERALRRSRADYEALSRLSAQLSTSLDELPAVMESRLGELQRADKRTRELAQQLAELTARDLYAQAAARGGTSGPVLHWQRGGTGTLPDQRTLAQCYLAQPRALFVAALEQPPSLLVAAAEDSGCDAAALLRAALAAAGGRGGGNARLAQGSVPSVDSLEIALNALQAQLGCAAGNSSR
jgi:alanyl-tRNA synthetase